MTHRNKVYRYFSLTELLIVISFLGILLSVLIPSLKNYSNNSLKLHCKNKIRLVTSTVNVISEDRAGLLVEGGSANPSWITNSTLGLFNQYDLYRKDLVCPSLDHLKRNKVDGNSPARSIKLIHNFYLGNNSNILRMRTERFDRLNYKIPKYNYEDGDSVLFTDGNALSNSGSGWTLSPHSDFDERIWEGYPIYPNIFGSDGGNIGYLDGSVQWKDYDDLNEYVVYRSTVDVIGMW